MATITTDDQGSCYRRCRKLLSSVWIFISGFIISATSGFLVHVCKKSSNMELPVTSTTARRSELMGDNVCPLSAGFPRTSRAGRNSLDSHLQRSLDRTAESPKNVTAVPDDSPAEDSDDDSSIVSAPFITSSTSYGDTSVTASDSWESHSVYSSPPGSVILRTPIITITGPISSEDGQVETIFCYDEDEGEESTEPEPEPVTQENNDDIPLQESVELACHPLLGSLAQRRGFHGDPIVTDFSKPQIILSDSISCWSPDSRRSSGSIPHKTPRTELLSPDAIYTARSYSSLSSSSSSSVGPRYPGNRLLNTPATIEPSPSVSFHQALMEVTAGLSLSECDLDEFSLFIDNLSIERKSPSAPPAPKAPHEMNISQGAHGEVYRVSGQLEDPPHSSDRPPFAQLRVNNGSTLSNLDSIYDKGLGRCLTVLSNSEDNFALANHALDAGNSLSDPLLVVHAPSAFSSTTSSGSLQNIALTDPLSNVDIMKDPHVASTRETFDDCSEHVTEPGSSMLVVGDNEERTHDDCEASEALKSGLDESTDPPMASGVSASAFPLLERSLENTNMSAAERHNAIKSWISLVNSSNGTDIAPGRRNGQRRLAHGDNLASSVTTTETVERGRLVPGNLPIATRGRSASLRHTSELPTARTRSSLVRRQSSLDNISARARAVALERHHASMIYTSRKRWSDPSAQGSPLRPLMLPIRLAMREITGTAAPTVGQGSGEGDTSACTGTTGASRSDSASSAQRASAMSNALLDEIIAALNSSPSNSGTSCCSEPDFGADKEDSDKADIGGYGISYGIAF